MIKKKYGSWFAVKLNSYENPTKTLRQCGLLHCRLELERILVIEYSAHALMQCDPGAPPPGPAAFLPSSCLLRLPPPSTRLPPCDSLPPSSCDSISSNQMEGGHWIHQNTPNRPWADAGTRALRQPYDNPTTNYGLWILILRGLTSYERPPCGTYLIWGYPNPSRMSPLPQSCIPYDNPTTTLRQPYDTAAFWMNKLPLWETVLHGGSWNDSYIYIYIYE